MFINTLQTIIILIFSVFLKQDTFTWEAKRLEILNLVFWKYDQDVFV